MPPMLEKMWAMPTASETAPPGRCMLDLDSREGTLNLGVDRREGVDGEIVAGKHDDGGDEGHGGDEAFDEHAAVADEHGLAFHLEHLGRRARADESVEAGDSAAGDGDEDERPDGAGDDGAAAGDERGGDRHVDIRLDDEDAEGQRKHGADLHVGAEVVARSEEQPDRQNGGDEAVDRQGDGDLFARKGEKWS